MACLETFSSLSFLLCLIVQGITLESPFYQFMSICERKKLFKIFRENVDNFVERNYYEFVS
ncbi:hypothetical protein SB48_HM08orf05802 [Heyndrickxia coagulans]|uniref:Uncharacterized protein n=1 Tax=Heyndrickxia coagulans TaxID=1398 RepID=A0AAN0T7U8_HEYCO|nr:hypothetical protein SB48_HM08orf05802 [Heyndrickxia coagulans]